MVGWFNGQIDGSFAWSHSGLLRSVHFYAVFSSLYPEAFSVLLFVSFGSRLSSVGFNPTISLLVFYLLVVGWVR